MGIVRPTLETIVLMNFCSFAKCVGIFALLTVSASAGWSQAGGHAAEAGVAWSSSELPDAPEPQIAQSTPAVPANETADEKKKREALAEEQLKVQKKQRVAGVLPNFNTSYDANAVSLTPKQKFKLAWASTTDPVQFAAAGFLAGIGQAQDSDAGYGQGMEGYAKRFGANYADTFIGNMLGNAVFPSLLHQDPRYFRLGYGSKTHRMLYALATNVITKHDVTGKWEPNYSNVAGNLIGGAISNVYYPADERGVSNTLTNALTVTLEGGLGSVFQEFWPDISRKLFHKDPTNGQDAKNAELRAQEKAEKKK